MERFRIEIDPKGNIRTDADPNCIIVGLYDRMCHETMGVKHATLPDHIDLVGAEVKEKKGQTEEK